MRFRWAPLLILLGMLAGCAHLPGDSAPAGMAQRPARTAIVAFALTGRLAIRQEQRSYAVGISWQHAAQSDEIMLASPLGQGIAELIRDAAGTRLITAERREYTAPDWQSLAARMFGLDLPIARMPHWLVGAVPEGAPGAKYDGRGRPRQLLEDGWRVAYLEYENDAANALPTLLELRRDDIEVRIKIDDWRLPP